MFHSSVSPTAGFSVTQTGTVAPPDTGADIRNPTLGSVHFNGKPSGRAGFVKSTWPSTAALGAKGKPASLSVTGSRQSGGSALGTRTTLPALSVVTQSAAESP